MKTILALTAGRSWPDHLLDWCGRQGCELRFYDAAAANGEPPLDHIDLLLVFGPFFYDGKYMSAETLWKKFLAANRPHAYFLTTGYQSAVHPNHLDLLALPDDLAEFLRRALPTDGDWQPHYSGGMDLDRKLRRFFAGHGQDSVFSVLTRVRLLVQMAYREVVDLGMPFDEAYHDLIAPAQLAVKWAEWEARWLNYYPLFRTSPLAGELARLGERMRELRPWMLGGGATAEPLRSGRAPAALDDVKTGLEQLDKHYVG